ncbi:hypothetical protein FRC12_017056, partial [Ceratobasidium sp. 428]
MLLYQGRVNRYCPLQIEAPDAQPRISQPRGFQALPLELVVMIAQCLSSTGRTSDLAALAALLPRDTDYTRVVQQVLFGHVQIESYARYASLTRTLQSGVTPDRCMVLASMIHNITAVLNTRPYRGEEQFLAKHILNLYDHCPELKHITLLGSRDDRFVEHLPPSDGDLELIESLGSIRCLTLTCPLGYLGPCLLGHLPSLQELHILGSPAILR